jgi:hypothetical protein
MSETTIEDYTPVLEALAHADREFTARYGCGAHHSKFDACLEDAAQQFNTVNNTDFDPVEARHQYLEQQEAKPWPKTKGESK